MNHVTVVLYHNITRDANDRFTGFFGYKPRHAVAPVFTYAAVLGPFALDDSAALTAVAEEALFLFNANCASLVPGKRRALVRRYHALCLRSLRVGDVVQIGRHLFAVTGADTLTRLMDIKLNVQPQE